MTEALVCIQVQYCWTPLNLKDNGHMCSSKQNTQSSAKDRKLCVSYISKLFFIVILRHYVLM